MALILSSYTLERQEILLTANEIRNNGENILLDIVKEAYRGIKSSDMILERGWEGGEVENVSLILIYQS